MERLHHSMGTYVRSMSKRKESDDKEKMLPIDVLAQTMISHGEEFESDSLFGTCLTSMSPTVPATLRGASLTVTQCLARRTRRLLGCRTPTFSPRARAGSSRWSVPWRR
jgi:hypothetical protein